MSQVEQAEVRHFLFVANRVFQREGLSASLEPKKRSSPAYL